MTHYTIFKVVFIASNKYQVSQIDPHDMLPRAQAPLPPLSADPRQIMVMKFQYYMHYGMLYKEMGAECDKLANVIGHMSTVTH